MEGVRDSRTKWSPPPLYLGTQCDHTPLKPALRGFVGLVSKSNSDRVPGLAALSTEGGSPLSFEMKEASSLTAKGSNSIKVALVREFIASAFLLRQMNHDHIYTCLVIQPGKSSLLEEDFLYLNQIDVSIMSF